MTEKKRPLNAWAVCGALVCSLWLPLNHVTLHASAQDQTIDITVDDPRPLARAVAQLESRFGWVITYEDPPLYYGADIEDVTLAVRKDQDRTKPVLGPRGGLFHASVPVQANNREEDAEKVLNAVLAKYNSSGLPGEFRLIRTGSVFHVVPQRSKSSRGMLERRASLLDRRISISADARTYYDAVEAITNAISEPQVARVIVGTIPGSLRIQSTGPHAGRKNDIARTLLMQALEATGSKLSWSLFCEPGPAPLCALNIHVVEHPTGASW